MSWVQSCAWLWARLGGRAGARDSSAPSVGTLGPSQGPAGRGARGELQECGGRGEGAPPPAATRQGIWPEEVVKVTCQDLAGGCPLQPWCKSRTVANNQHVQYEEKWIKYINDSIKWNTVKLLMISDQISRSVVSDSLRPHESQHRSILSDVNRLYNTVYI